MRDAGDEPPSLDSFDLSGLSRPDDGILYLYRAFDDGFWRIDTDADIAIEGATGHTIAEIDDAADDEDWTPGEDGEVIAVYLPWAGDEDEEPDGDVECWKCGDPIDTLEDTHYRLKEEERPVAQLEKDREDLEFDDYLARGWYFCSGCIWEWMPDLEPEEGGATAGDAE